LDIEPTGKAIHEIAKAWLTEFKVLNIIGKDSLDMSENDRELIVSTIQKSSEKNIIIVHGTDTIDKTANFIEKAKLDKRIVLTGAMVPYSINPIEATSNLCSSYGFLYGLEKKGVFISMNNIIKGYKRVVKNKEKGYFEDSK